MGGSGILKTRKFGYDGKGQVRLSHTSADDGTMNEAVKLCNSVPCILEGLISFQCEISVIAARGTNGSIEIFDPAENVHREGILRTSTLPASVSEATLNRAKELAVKTLEALDYVGVIGIEFFVLEDGSLIANEFAPRVHNSGHWTEAACTISQFEQHIRAIAGLPLGKTARHSNCVMENLIGDDMDKLPDLQRQADTLIHLYGKSETRPGRKMGHVTQISPLT